MIEGYDRCDRITQTKSGKQNELLYLVIESVGSDGRFADTSENQVSYTADHLKFLGSFSDGR